MGIPASGGRLESFILSRYRFPLFPDVDTTLSYQSVINLASTRDPDHAPAFSLGLRTTL